MMVNKRFVGQYNIENIEKNMTRNGKKSRPAETDPYAYESGRCLEMVIQFLFLRLIP